MGPKYKLLTNDTETIDDIILYRIEALENQKDIQKTKSKNTNNIYRFNYKSLRKKEWLIKSK